MKRRNSKVLLSGLFAVAIIFLGVWVSAGEFGKWTEMRLPHVGDVWNLKATAFAKPGVGWAVGANEGTGCAVVLKHEADRWQKVYSGCKGKSWTMHLVDIALSGPENGWAVGDKYYIWSDPDRFKGFAVRLSGNKCKEVRLPNVGRSFKLEAVSIPPGTNEAWAVGGVAQKKTRTGLVLHYTGRWNKVDVSLPGNQQWWELKDIDCPAPDRCWAVGNIIYPRWAEAGQRSKKRPKDANQLLIMSYHDGIWRREENPSAPEDVVNPSILTVSFPTPDTGWAAGKGVMFHYSNGKWEADAPPQRASGWHIKGLSFPASDHGYAVGWDLENKKPLWLERTEHGWRRIKTPFDRKLMMLNDVFFLRPDLGWAVGGIEKGSKYPAGAFSYRTGTR